MARLAGIEVHPSVVALRQVELRTQQQQLQEALTHAQQTCEVDQLYTVLDINGDGLFLLRTIRC